MVLESKGVGNLLDVPGSHEMRRHAGRGQSPLITWRVAALAARCALHLSRAPFQPSTTRLKYHLPALYI